MKRAILLLCAVICGVTTTAAQDLIVKRDASKIEAKVTEITPDEVRYKRFSNLDGPTYVVPVNQIDFIQYINGEKEQFAKTEDVNMIPLTPATPATEHHTKAQIMTSPAVPVQYVIREFEIGEIYDYDGVKGIVCALDESRQHGLIMSMDEIYLHWSSFRKPNMVLVGADDRKSGEVNMAKVADYIVANNLSWDDFPAFKWCQDKGEGWYFPSIDEMLTIGHNYNGGSRMKNNRQVRNRFNDALKNSGGKRMDRMVYYFSSTEMDEKNAFTTHMAIEPPYVVEIPKNTKFLVRAVHKF